VAVKISLAFYKKIVIIYNMKTVDDRNESQKITHKWAIVAKDKCMSGWGGATGGASRVAWAIDGGANAEKLLRWVSARSEMVNVNHVNLDTYRAPRGTSHFHIYVANASHPAFD
jgi:hypothetical protein